MVWQVRDIKAVHCVDARAEKEYAAALDAGKQVLEPLVEKVMKQVKMLQGMHSLRSK